MADAARLRFKSLKNPKEHGTLLLTDDGMFRVEPSPEFRDEMARLEEVALNRSQTYGTRVGIVLLTLGALAVGIGWLVGRLFGRLGNTLSTPRPVSEVRLTREEGGVLRVTLRGAESRLQVVQMAWNADEYLEPEAETFLKKFQEMQE